ncbi:MAG: bifunctional 4-hydroxy-3-methylbut-2-enyl diphosphate reductase/30S ribosomal protein S1 [Syntrophomonas sp.]
MRVKIADKAGFCAGVRRAVKIAEEAAVEGEKWYTLGPLVHNDAVIKYFKDKGIDVATTVAEAEPEGIIIRSHGTTPEIIREIRQKGLRINDATCPLVKKVHDLAAMLESEGYEIVVYGDSSHPEVEGILGWCNNKATVIASIDQLSGRSFQGKLGVVSQTTKDAKSYYEVIAAVLPGVPEVRVFNTICPATRDRQAAARSLCQQVDIMLVIGDNNSSNTATLARECIYTGVRTFRIQNAREINSEWFDGVTSVGITAGASTPDWIIKEVLEKMSEFDENAPQEQTQETVTNEEVGAKEESFAKMEAEMADFTTPNRGDIIKGTVIQVLDDEVMVDVGGKSEGIIPAKELSVKDVNSAKELVKVGDEIEVLVLKWDDDGTILLSKKKVDAQKALDKLEEDYNNDKVVEGTILSSVKGGLLVDVGVVAFLPASHVDYGYVKNMDDYVGKTFNFKIIEFNRNKRRGSQIVVSRKQLVEAEKSILKEQFWGNIEEGQTRTGKVKRIVDYGAFIDLGGYEGLLHVSEIDHVRVEHPSNVLSEGEEIEVYILALDREKQRVSLSRKKLIKSPWEVVLEKYNEGDIIEGTVVRTAPFGAFVEIEPGVDGLVHISQLADHRVEKPEDIVTAGEKVQIKILNIDPEEKRISLSIKDAHQEGDKKELEELVEKYRAIEPL